MKGLGKNILVIGSGPIIIGQACEFDYSGTQACRALKEEGAKVVLINSNPATIMTDPTIADRTYIEPLTHDIVSSIIEKERPDSILPTVGGQVGLNLAIQLSDSGILDKFNVKLIGASINSIRLAEDRELFSKAMKEIGLSTPKSIIINDIKNIKEVFDFIGLPAIIRPSFTLGGSGGGMAYNYEEFCSAILYGLEESPQHQVLVEQSVEGWKEFELEVMRDKADNVVIICSIENLDPMGIHTGDSITIAPAQTLTDKEYQIMRNAAISIIRKIGVETGGCNIQFAINPENGMLYVIEMNPRVSRSSALASKATGFPIAKIAAKLALGYTLDQIPNDITQTTTSCFEPVLDYVVVKIPRFDFDKFPGVKNILGPQMKSVGEVMAIGRTFKEAFRKGLASLDYEIPLYFNDWKDALKTPTPDRIFAILEAIKEGYSLNNIYNITKIDYWFLHQFKSMIEDEKNILDLTKENLFNIKRNGILDKEIARHKKCDEKDINKLRENLGIKPTYHCIDTCAGEFESFTPYFYSSYETNCESKPSSKKKVIILGSGPNRIGQGIEFDYCCCHASYVLKKLNIETIMINCNPETVSTDYNTSDRLYFEPLTLEHVLSIVNLEKPYGIIVQLGGQTPLKLAGALEKEGFKILGTVPEAIDLAEDRKRFGLLIESLNILQPKHGFAHSLDEALNVANNIKYPILVRPSYVLGGRAMRIIYNEDGLRQYLTKAVIASDDRPVLIDHYLEDAFEYDVDAISDSKEVVIAGILQHVEKAGIHSGDSTAFYPPYKIKKSILEKIRTITKQLGIVLGVKGLMNVQFAEKDGELYVLEVNPRASRTVPFLAKATGIPLVQHAVRVMMGETLNDIGFIEEPIPSLHFVKAPVFPFKKFPGADILLGPEMCSTGEVMGIGATPDEALVKAMLSAGVVLSDSGSVFISVNDNDKEKSLIIAQHLHDLGLKLYATKGTAIYLFDNGIPVQLVFKVNDRHPNATDLIRNHDIQLVINIPLGSESYYDEKIIRIEASTHGIPCITTLAAAEAVVTAVRNIRNKKFNIYAIQDY